MDIIVGIIVGLIILVILVVVHELGHAIVASRNGVVVEEFGIGFPPRAWGRKLKNGVLFSLNWLPLGGFVKLQGEHDAADKKGDYGAASFWQKTKILFAGVITNWIVAAVLLSILALTGLPKVLPDQFSIPSDRTDTAQPVELTQLVKNYPAEKAGLKAGDQIVRFAGQEVPDSQTLINLAKKYKGQRVEVIYTRGGEESTIHVNLRNASSEDFGAELGQREIITATWSAPIVGVVTTAQFTGVTFQGLGNLVANLVSGLALQLSPSHSAHVTASSDLAAVSDSVAGPVGILGTIFPAAEKAGPTQLVFLSAIISLTLAVMNTLPIPALDGGRWFVSFLYRIFKRPLSKEREERIQGIGFTVLMLLVVVVTVGDVAKLSKNPHVERVKVFLHRNPWFVIALPLWVYAGFMLGQLVVQLIALGLVSLGVHLDSINSAVLSTVVAASIYLVTLVIVIGFPVLIKNQKFNYKELGVWRLTEWMDIILAPAGFVVYIILSGLLAYTFSQLFPHAIETVQNTGFSNLTSSYQYVLAFVTLVIIAPFAEELLFRGYLLGKLIKYAPIWLSVLITSLLFGFLHMTISGGSISGWSLGLDTFALSLVLCTLRLITRSLWPSILLHMIKNGIAFAILFIIPLLSGTLVK